MNFFKRYVRHMRAADGKLIHNFPPPNSQGAGVDGGPVSIPFSISLTKKVIQTRR